MATSDPNEKSNEFNHISPSLTMFDVVMKCFTELAPREAELMYWNSIGLQQAEIADMMKITTTSVKTYTNNCKKKLNISTSNALRAVYHCRMMNFSLSLMINKH
ncbi:helix-turn-helix transcriptional regulator [Photobacterium sp. R1]